MTPSNPFATGLATIAVILAAMAVVAGIETAIPLHARGRWNRIHLAPNLALTFLTFATNLFLNAALVLTVVGLESRGLGLLRLVALPPFAAAIIAVAALDLSFYAAHRSWHAFPSLWRFHAVHHSDPAVDVTTTIRQHPVESLLRYAAMGAMAIAIGPSPAAFAFYRVTSALNGFLEHANIRAPRWLDRLLSLVTTWPHLHKVHHSRRVAQTNTNYGNLFSVWDRLFGTFTPSSEGTTIAYGLDGHDDPARQTTAALLALPFRDLAVPRASAPGAMKQLLHP
jgi:sterol desaturase/sphingolipid hydroxylase (fatty acid hydroxylase superfamily)